MRTAGPVLSGSRLELVRVGSAGGRDGADFVSLPYHLHGTVPQWVPYPVREIRHALSRRHPFFRHSDAAFFLARRGRAPAGRIAVMDNRRYNEYRGHRHAFFYYFDSLDDPQVAALLLDAAREWARGRGLTELRGPQGFSALSGGGILIDGFQHASAMTQMCWHPPYYRRLVEQAGLSRLKDFYSARLDAARYVLPDRVRVAAERILARGRFRIHRLRRQIPQVAEGIGRLYNAAWVEHGDVVPLGRQEVISLSRDLRAVTDPAFIQIVLYDEELVGFLLAFPDLSRAIRRHRGRFGPVALLDLALEKRRTRRLIVNGIGIAPEQRRLGGNALLYYALERAVRESGRDIREVELPQIAETTRLMLSDAATLGAEVHKTHRVYQASL